MIKTKITYITTDGTEFPESIYPNAKNLAEEYEINYLKQMSALKADVLFLNEQGQICDYEHAQYVKITNLRGVEGLKAFCKLNGLCTIWEDNPLDEKPGLYAWDWECDKWINLEETILKYEKIKDMLENFKITK